MATIYIDNKPYQVEEGQKPSQRLPLFRVQHSLFLLAPGHAFGRGLSPVRGEGIQG